MSDDDATKWMIGHLRGQIAALELQGYEHHAEQVEGLDVTRRIIERVLPGEPFDIDPFEDVGWQWRASTIASKALGVLQNRSEILQYLGPTGPTMPAEELHPVIWGMVSDLWKGEHYRTAVARAATFLNAHVQDKSTRTDLSDKDLMTNVFKDVPGTAESPRLRWNGPGTAQTRKSMLAGIMFYAQGVSMTIRNPAVHETDEMTRQVALEQLAALSLLARWVDECDVDRGADPS